MGKRETGEKYKLEKINIKQTIQHTLVITSFPCFGMDGWGEKSGKAKYGRFVYLCCFYNLRGLRGEEVYHI